MGSTTSVSFPEDNGGNRRSYISTAPFGTLARAIREGTYDREAVQEGERIHHYRILRQLGRGGMGSVFVAEHVYLKQEVAFKTLIAQGADWSDSGEYSERFLREAQALAVLSGPNVLPVLDASVFDGKPYVVTELLVGQTLRDHLRAHGPLTINQVMDFLEQIGDVLIRQERYGILHRDIKPSNVWIRNDGSFCLIDYGLVGFADTGPSHILGGEVVTVAGSVMGTPMYMAPEQASGVDPVDHRTDLFGLGVTAWECLAGSPPRDASDPATLLMQASKLELPSIVDQRSDVTPGFERILSSLTAMRREDRYATASALIQDLDHYRYGGRRPYGATMGSAFVAIPFHMSFGGLFEFLQDVCAEAKLAARRVDRVSTMTEIWNQIDKEIRIATVVIAVFTRERFQQSPNANVLTEAAHARALGRPLIVLTTDRAEKLPFDWRHLPVIRYVNSKRGLRALREELVPRLRQELRQQRQSRGQ